MNKCKQIAMLEDARDNALDLYNLQKDKKHPDEEDKILIESYKNEIDDLEQAIDNPSAFALNIFRYTMRDKALGELHYGWMCNIKWAVYDAILDRLLK